jgi:hypothetical protein
MRRRFLFLISSLVFVAFVPNAYAQSEDFFPVQPPNTLPETQDLVDQIKDLQDVPSTEPAIIYEETVKARRLMQRYRGFKIQPSQYDEAKSEFRESIAALQSVMNNNCDRNAAAEIRTRLSGLTSSDFFAPSAYPKTAQEARRLGLLSDPEICKAVKSNTLAITKIHDDEVAANQKRDSDRLNYAEQIASAYADRYRRLQGLAKRSSESFWIRVTVMIVVISVIVFAWLIFTSAKTFSDNREIQMELISSGQLIQFPTVMVLLVVIVVLGLTAVLDDKTLGTLLGGIAGYVLSQGIGRAASREAVRAFSTGQQIGQGPRPPAPPPPLPPVPVAPG